MYWVQQYSCTIYYVSYLEFCEDYYLPKSGKDVLLWNVLWDWNLSGFGAEIWLPESCKDLLVAERFCAALDTLGVEETHC